MQYCLYLRKSRADSEAEALGEGETLARHEKALLDLAKKLNLNIITASVTVSAVSKESMNGTVSTLPAAANAQTNLYDVSVSLPSGTKPPIGAFATVTFYTDRRASTISVPTESILTGNNNEQYVFTVNADGTAATRVTVTTGLVTKDSTEIVSGLKAGDRVVTKGQSYLSDGAAVHVVTSDATDGGEG